MAIQLINVGQAPNDGTGDTGRVGAEKINSNFEYLETKVNELTTTVTNLPEVPTVIKYNPFNDSPFIKTVRLYKDRCIDEDGNEVPFEKISTDPEEYKIPDTTIAMGAPDVTLPVIFKDANNPISASLQNEEDGSVKVTPVKLFFYGSMQASSYMLEENEYLEFKLQFPDTTPIWMLNIFGNTYGHPGFLPLLIPTTKSKMDDIFDKSLSTFRKSAIPLKSDFDYNVYINTPEKVMTSPGEFTTLDSLTNSGITLEQSEGKFRLVRPDTNKVSAVFTYSTEPTYQVSPFKYILFNLKAGAVYTCDATGNNRVSFPSNNVFMCVSPDIVGILDGYWFRIYLDGLNNGTFVIVQKDVNNQETGKYSALYVHESSNQRSEYTFEYSGTVSDDEMASIDDTYKASPDVIWETHDGCVVLRIPEVMLPNSEGIWP